MKTNACILFTLFLVTLLGSSAFAGVGLDSEIRNLDEVLHSVVVLEKDPRKQKALRAAKKKSRKAVSHLDAEKKPNALGLVVGIVKKLEKGGLYGNFENEVEQIVAGAKKEVYGGLEDINYIIGLCPEKRGKLSARYATLNSRIDADVEIYNDYITKYLGKMKSHLGAVIKLEEKALRISCWDRRLEILCGQTGPVVANEDDYLVPFCVEVIDRDRQLIGGTLTIKGPKITEVIIIKPENCVFFGKGSECEVFDDNLYICSDYHVNDPVKWSIQFTATTASGKKVSCTLKPWSFPNCLSLTAELTGPPIGIAGGDVWAPFRIEIRDCNYTLEGGKLFIEGPRGIDTYKLNSGFCGKWNGETCEFSPGKLIVTGDYALPSSEALSEMVVGVLNRMREPVIQVGLPR